MQSMCHTSSLQEALVRTKTKRTFLPPRTSTSEIVTSFVVISTIKPEDRARSDRVTNTHDFAAVPGKAPCCLPSVCVRVWGPRGQGSQCELDLGSDCGCDLGCNTAIFLLLTHPSLRVTLEENVICPNMMFFSWKEAWLIVKDFVHTVHRPGQMVQNSAELEWGQESGRGLAFFRKGVWYHYGMPTFASCRLLGETLT